MNQQNIRLPTQAYASDDAELLHRLLRSTFDYFTRESHPVTGLIADKTAPGFPSSIAVTGMGITAFIIGVEQGFITRAAAAARVQKLLLFLYQGKQGMEENAMGYKGFYYHFLDMQTGERAWKSELSTMDTALLMAGVLNAATYFSGTEAVEVSIRETADQLYRRVDWQWALNGKATLSHGWRPGQGFLRYRWNQGYSEAILLYVLALASPTYPIAPVGYQQWINTFSLTRSYHIDYLYAGPLFIHQFSHLYIDFRNIYDDFNRRAGFDYFENSARATRVHQQYALHDPNRFGYYGKDCWGLSAGDGPCNKTLARKDGKRRFYNYKARGAPYGPDDGTIAPWSVVASLPFAPQLVLETMRNMITPNQLKGALIPSFSVSINPAFTSWSAGGIGWLSPYVFGINEAPMLMMIANFQNELVWNLAKQCPYFACGLQRAGFTGGWLSPIAEPVHQD